MGGVRQSSNCWRSVSEVRVVWVKVAGDRDGVGGCCDVLGVRLHRTFASRGRRLEPLLAALVGGFAGALVTGGLSAWHEHRRDRRMLRAATRLVAGELRTIESRLQVTAASGTWRELRRRPLAHEEWDEH